MKWLEPCTSCRNHPKALELSCLTCRAVHSYMTLCRLDGSRWMISLCKQMTGQPLAVFVSKSSSCHPKAANTTGTTTTAPQTKRDTITRTTNKQSQRRHMHDPNSKLLKHKSPELADDDCDNQKHENSDNGNCDYLIRSHPGKPRR